MLLRLRSRISFHSVCNFCHTVLTKPYVHPSLSYTYGISNQPPLLLTAAELLKEFRTLEDQPKLISHHENLIKTYKDLDEESDRLGSFMHFEMGISKGDIAGIWSCNTYNWLVVHMALNKIGAILCTINPFYKVNELKYLIHKSKLKLLFIPGFNSPQLQINNFHEIIKDSEIQSNFNKFDLENIILIDGEKDCDTLGNYNVKHINECTSEKKVNIKLENDDPSLLVFTSGTTGNPKGVLLSQFNYFNTSFFTGLKLSQDGALCCPLPLFHIFALCHGFTYGLIFKKTIVFTGFRFTPKSVAQSIAKYKCTNFIATPTMLFDLIDYSKRRKADLSSLRVACLGGAPVSPKLGVNLSEIIPNAKIFIGYGATETGSCCTCNDIDDSYESRTNTCGKVIPNIELKIVDLEKGNMIPSNEKGEIWVRSFYNMRGYFDDPDKTHSVITQNGWYRTGDIGCLNKEGELSIVGRIKDMIIRGGENIYPKEVENVVSLHPSIVEVQVFGIPDEKYGEQVCAWIKLKESEKLNENDIKEFLKDKITYFKIPKYIFFVDSFPLTSNGKISKYLMAQESIKLLGNK